MIIFMMVGHYGKKVEISIIRDNSYAEKYELARFVLSRPLSAVYANQRLNAQYSALSIPIITELFIDCGIRIKSHHC